MTPKSKTLYLSGPMSGVKDYNAPAFDEMESRLKDLGYCVVNPTSFGHPEPGEPVKPWAHYLRKDIRAMMAHCDAVAVLPGWTKSRGACLECLIAAELGWPVYFADELAEGVVEVVDCDFLEMYKTVTESRSLSTIK